MMTGTGNMALHAGLYMKETYNEMRGSITLLGSIVQKRGQLLREAVKCRNI